MNSNLTTCSPLVAQKKSLVVPKISTSRLSLNLLEPHASNDECKIRNFKLPMADGEVCDAKIISATVLTSSHAQSKTLELWLSSKELLMSCKDRKVLPGDVVGILPENSKDEVDWILKRVKEFDNADLNFSISTTGGSLKHLPKVATLRNIFTHYIDIRGVLKKNFIYQLAQFCSCEREKRILTELSSRECSKEYLQIIVSSGLRLSDLLQAFPSCLSPVSLLIQHLPPLFPRCYSVASSLSQFPSKFRLLVTVVNLPKKGICSSYLDSISNPFQKNLSDTDDVDILGFESLHILERPTIKLYIRSAIFFRPPADISIPLLLVATGAGLAPFLGFLQDMKSGPVWLLYGCRNAEEDYLCRSELENSLRSGGIHRLDVALSQPSCFTPHRYVQHVLLSLRDTLSEWLVSCSVYVCGRSPAMHKAVHQALLDGLKVSEPESVLAQWKKSGRYKVDTW